MTSTLLKTLKVPHFSSLCAEDVEAWITKAEKYLDLSEEEYLRVISALSLLDNHASAWALTFETFEEDFTIAI
ncbi:hypothetical protein BGZ76_004574, partial [Entomortierella beljakovae]